MPDSERIDVVRRCFAAFAAQDRQAIEGLLGEDLRFSAPPDPSLDRDGPFARCWPNAGQLEGSTSSASSSTATRSW